MSNSFGSFPNPFPNPFSKTKKDIVNSVKPDERSLMTYISCFYHAFSGANTVNNFAGFSKEVAC